MAFVLLSRSRSKTQGSVKPVLKQKSTRGQHSADSRFGFAKPVFQPQTAALPTAPVIQTKLEVGEPDDKFEEEADRVAELTGNDNGSIPPSAAARNRSPVGSLQRLYGNQAVLQMRHGSGGLPAPLVPLRLRQSGILQRKCACGGAAGMSGECEECKKKRMLGIQTKLTINVPGDQFEQEADRVAEQVMRMPDRSSGNRELSFSSAPASAAQRKCTVCEQEEDETVQRKESGEPAQVNPLSAAITPLEGGNSEPGVESASGFDTGEARAIEDGPGGRPLPESVRNYMEPRFGADFSAVRLHSGPEAARLNARLHSQAFTYGRDIWLGDGESASNLPLLAHELTHVLQQSPSLARSPQSPKRSIQRKNSYFSLLADKKFVKGSPGQKTHDIVMGEIAKLNENKGLLFEVNIPGAKKGVKAKFVPDESAVVGRADFFKANTTIGVKFIGDDPTPYYLASHRALRIAGGEDVGMTRFAHAKKAAPVAKNVEKVEFPKKQKKIPKEVAKACPNLPSVGVCRLGSAPEDIGLGDIKPPDLAERIEGADQVRFYGEGIRETAQKVNEFVNNTQSKSAEVQDYVRDHPGAYDDLLKPWNPAPRPLGEGEVEIPSKYKRGSKEGKPLAVYRFWQGKPDYDATPQPIPAHLYLVYDTSNPGIWMYEYVPTNIPKTGPDDKAKQQKVLTPLEDPVRKDLKSKPQVLPKRKPGPPPPVARRRIQRTRDKSFNFYTWVKKFNKWQVNDAKPYLKSKEGQKAGILETLVDIKNRSMPDLPIPAAEEKIGAGERKIRHWNNEGRWYGLLRGLFGDIYTKFLGLFYNARDKFRKFLPKSSEGPSGGFRGKVIKVGMKILRYTSYVILHEVADRLKTAFITAAENLVENLFNKEVAAFEEELEKVKAYIKDFEATIELNILGAIEKAIKPFLDIVNRIREVVDEIKDILKWVDRAIKAARVLACLLKPGFGCLFGFISSKLLEALLAVAAGKCGFRKEMFAVIRSVSFVKRLPDEIAKFVTDQLMELLPPKAKELIGQPKKGEPDLSEVTGCEDYSEEPEDLRSGLSSEDRADFDRLTSQINQEPTEVAKEMVRLHEKWQKHPGKPLPALAQLLKASGFGLNLPPNMPDLKRIDDFLEAINGDGKKILDYIKALRPGFRSGKPTIKRILDEAERSILYPALAPGYVPSRLPEPRQEEAPEEGGVVIIRF